jgi:LysM repeat protein
VQAFKTLVIVAVLSAVGYGVYMALTGARDVEPPPGATAEDWQGAPQIELPSVDSSQPTVLAPAAQAAPHIVQPQPGPPVDAPRYNAGGAQQDAGAAPPFVAPNVGPSDPAALPSGATPGGAQEGAPFPTQDSAMLPAPGPPAAGVVDGAVASAVEAPPVADAMPGGNFATDYAAAQALLAENRLDPALLLLSRWYESPQLGEAEQQALLAILNQLAGTVIYSREHLLLPPYEVQPGDTLDRIAQQYQVPWQLLAKINGVSDPNLLRPGDKLKVIQGPFDAVINLRTQHLTLMLSNRFAGRFPVGIGADQSTPEGEFAVKVKQPNPKYFGPDRVIEAGDPSNPLGKYWIGLDDHFGIHGTNDPQSIGRADSRGCIRLHPRDIEDVYDMMTVESRVRILR